MPNVIHDPILITELASQLSIAIVIGITDTISTGTSRQSTKTYA